MRTIRAEALRKSVRRIRIATSGDRNPSNRLHLLPASVSPWFNPSHLRTSAPQRENERIVKVQVVSDLHLEMNPCEVPVVGDVVVLAGDIHVGTEGIAWAKSHFAERPVVYVAGNHEFYRYLFPDLIQDLRAEADGSNVAFLENDAFIVNGVRFLGATLWTDFTLNGYARQDINMAAAEHGLNDLRAIKKATVELLRPTDVAEAHRRSVEWLRARLAEGHEGPTVVVTHHVPCIMSRKLMRGDGVVS